MIEGNDIICSSTDWDGDPLSKKHIVHSISARVSGTSRDLRGERESRSLHAEAHNVSISLASARDAVEMKIVDDGRGFDVRRTFARPSESFGIRAMRERVEILGGTIHFYLHPARRGAEGGAAVEARLPLRHPEVP